MSRGLYMKFQSWQYSEAGRSVPSAIGLVSAVLARNLKTAETITWVEVRNILDDDAYALKTGWTRCSTLSTSRMIVMHHRQRCGDPMVVYAALGGQARSFYTR